MSLRCALACPIKLVSCAIFCGALLLPAVAGGQATQYKDAPPLLVGAAWYPEQWDEDTSMTGCGRSGSRGRWRSCWVGVSKSSTRWISR
jgi:hypothetical protein